MKKILIVILFAFFIPEIQAQFSRDEAINIIIEKEVGEDSLQIRHLYSKLEQMGLEDTLWLDGYLGFYFALYIHQWVFFIDDFPPANWAHPCKIIFFNSDNGEYETYEEDWPPHPFLSNSVQFFENWEWILSVQTDKDHIPSCPITLYPNPCIESLYLSGPVEKNAMMEIQVLSLAGRIVQDYQFTTNQFPVEIGTASLEAGIYTIVFYLEGDRPRFRKFIKLN